MDERERRFERSAFVSAEAEATRLALLARRGKQPAWEDYLHLEQLSPEHARDYLLVLVQGRRLTWERIRVAARYGHVPAYLATRTRPAPDSRLPRFPLTVLDTPSAIRLGLDLAQIAIAAPLAQRSDSDSAFALRSVSACVERARAGNQGFLEGAIRMLPNSVKYLDVLDCLASNVRDVLEATLFDRPPPPGVLDSLVWAWSADSAHQATFQAARRTALRTVLGWRSAIPPRTRTRANTLASLAQATRDPRP